MDKRGSGILLHIISLPSSFGIGDMGPEAYRFVDFLSEAKQRIWQILPLNPTEPIHNHSPYHSTSAFAGNPLLISPDLLVRDDFLTPSDLEGTRAFPPQKVDYRTAQDFKGKILDQAYRRFKNQKTRDEYESFCRKNRHWLDDFALFIAIKLRCHGQGWSDWAPDLRDRQKEALLSAQRELSGAVEKEKFFQYIFFKQWKQLKKYGNDRGVRIFGDIPIYVDYDSADLWVHPELFKLDESKKPYVVAGVPPDYFSATGQLWGNPLYRWDALKATGYGWWVKRIAHNLKLFDYLRIDHFRGLVAYWEVPATEPTAINGKWVNAPAMDFFQRLAREFPSLPVIAEDLGTITEDVREVMRHFKFPGMKVLLFAFGPDLPTNPYIPHNLPKNCVAYTGTHDNNTVRGWFEKDATPEEKGRLFRYLGREIPVAELSQEMIRLLMMSVAKVVIFPMQDILNLGAEARMNCPSTRDGNWECRLMSDGLSPTVAAKLREMTEIYGRA